ncbi:MAG: hypothetical protein ACREME_13200, partial [Gemmatimonadales bacterium]
LWRGQVGLDTTRFDPFLRSVSTSFSVSAATLRGIGALLGLVPRRRPPAPVPAASRADSTPIPGGMTDAFRRYDGATRDAFGEPYGAEPAGEGRRPFSLNVAYSSTRTRDPIPTQTAVGGRQVVTLSLGFSPTRNWSASWYTSYDFDTRQFAQHNVRLERDLHRWRASFEFSKSANGNFVFNFNIALIDQSDIHFDYDQRTFAR